MSTPPIRPGEPDDLLRQLLSGRPDVADALVRAMSTSHDTATIVAAAVLRGDSQLLSTARPVALTSRDRQLLALASARLHGRRDLFDVLVREHLIRFPDDVLASWIAGRP